MLQGSLFSARQSNPSVASLELWSRELRLGILKQIQQVHHTKPIPECLLSPVGHQDSSCLDRHSPRSSSSPIVYCLWLLPSSSDCEHLSVQIKTLAGRAPPESPSPEFDPHVTFLSGLSLDTDVEVLKHAVQQGLRLWSRNKASDNKASDNSQSRPLELSLEEPINGGSFYTAMIYPVEQSSSGSAGDETAFDRLISGRSILESLLASFYSPRSPGFSPKPYFPHLSLQYSSMDKSDLDPLKREFVKFEKAQGRLPSKVTIDRCALMHLEGEVPQWKTVKVFRLDGQEA